MKTPLDNDLNESYEAFNQDHERLRHTFMDSVAPYSKRQKQISPFACVWNFIGVTIMRNRITKLTTAAVIAVAVIIGVRGFNGTTAWAEVIKAFNSADNIHIVTKVTRSNGQVREIHSWLKNRTMLRDESPEEITVDDGENRLILDRREMTAQLSDSYSPFEDYMETGNFEIILLFSGRETPFKATELADETTSSQHIYEVTYRDTWKGKAWVDAKSNLPLRITATFTEEYRGRLLGMEVEYNYEPIPLEVFNLDIPPDYTQLPRVQTRFFSGRVIDEEGEPVTGAEVVTLEGIRGQTNQKGEFAIKLHPGRRLGGFPMIVRAVKSSDPARVAWTLLRNPRHDLRPLFRPDDGKTKLEQGSGIDIRLVDEKELIEFIPDNLGKVIFENEEDRHPKEITDIVLQMGPASVITGRIVDQEAQPIANAIVWIDHMAIAVGENEIEIRELRHTAKERAIISSIDYEEFDEIKRKAFAVTDKDGRYEIGHLPDVWYRVRLEARADGYVSEAKEIFQPKGADFSLFEAGVTIRGTVIDNHGLPLVGREVKIDVDSDEDWDFDVEEVLTDAQGRFELTGIPSVEGLELQIRTDEKPRDWEENELTRDREFIYYLMIEEPIKLIPGKKEYYVEIVPHRPDIVLEIEVKDSKGNLLEGVPVGICSSGFSERVWYTSKLNGKTDKTGLCIIEEVPQIEPLTLWVCKPITRAGVWEIEQEVNVEVKSAITEFSSKYHPIEETIGLEKGKKKYQISVVLKPVE